MTKLMTLLCGALMGIYLSVGSVSAEDKELPFYTAFVRNAEELKSGSFIATGQRVIVSAESKNETARPIRVEEQFEVGFDYAADKSYFIHAELPVDVPEEHRYSDWRKSWIGIHPDQFTHGLGSKTGTTPRIQISLRNREAANNLPIVRRPLFDVRMLPICKVSAPRHSFKPDAHGFGTAKFQYLGSESTMSHYRATHQLEKSSIYYFCDYWTDQEQGNQIVRYEEKTIDLAKEDEHARGAYATTLTTWNKVNNIWVPTQVKLTEPDTTLTIDFEWDRVNDPIDEDKFSWKGWNLPVNTKVYDARDETNVKLIEVIGRPNSPTVVPPQ